MDLAKYDDLISRIMEEERQIYPFLDVIFGFLSRRTDFFVIQEEGSKLGFPPGGAEKVLMSVFCKWQKLSSSNLSKSLIPKQDSRGEIFPDGLPALHEEVVATSAIDKSPKVVTVPKVKKPFDEIKKVKRTVCSSDIYNGADRGTYHWSQSIGDLEVLVPVPEYIKKSKDVSVLITDLNLSVKVKDKCDSAKWNILVDGEFCYKVNKEESIWSLLPGHVVSIHCDKIKERWWDGLLTSEPKLDGKRIDASRPMSDLSEEDQMKVEEFMWNEERKQLGLKTSEQLKAEEILKDAWNVEGSPFKGTKFDPTVLNFNANSASNMDSEGNG